MVTKKYKNSTQYMQTESLNTQKSAIRDVEKIKVPLLH
ncbi:hypothetical protein MNBD_GAMMA18-243, partial [hydrothermal vent metagenome]